jgi:glycosyltransferase involved in cell wall biosynthesis
MRVVQLSCFRDPRRLTGAEMLDAWTGLTTPARAAAAAGFDVHVVHAAWRDEEIVRDGVRYRFVAEPAGLPDRLSSRLQRRLARAVRALRPDVCHVKGLAFPQARWICDGAPVLAQDHCAPPWAGWRAAAQRWGLARIRGLAVTSREHAEPFFAAGVVRREVPVFEVLESTTEFTPGDVAAARAETGIGGDPCVLWLGHLDENKDPLTILDALSRASVTLPGIRLWMCFGNEPLGREVRARIAADPALVDRVTLLGRVEHDRVETLCRAADVFVQGSRKEASSYALMESMACGVTPLVSDIPGFRRMTGGGAVGGLFPRGDAAALADLLVRFAARDRAALREAARAHFQAHLSLDALSRELAAAYTAVAGR